MRRVGSKENSCYIPFHERRREQIAGAIGRDIGGSILLAMGQAAFKTMMRYQSVNEIARQNGWRYFTDPEARAAFEGLAYGLKRKHVTAIEEAKTSGTWQRRIAKLITTLRQGRPARGR
jgi:hypothetical protein